MATSPPKSGTILLKTGTEVSDPRANLQLQTPHQQPQPATLTLPLPAGMLPAAQPVPVMPVVPTQTPVAAAVNVAPAPPTAALTGGPLVAPVGKPMTVLKTQQPTAEQSKIFDSYSEHLEVFLVEVYRCKLCKFHSAMKAVMATHMTEKHSPVSGVSNKPNLSVDQVSGASVRELSVNDITQLPSAAPFGNQGVALSSETIAQTSTVTQPNITAPGAANAPHAINCASSCDTVVSDSRVQVGVSSETNPTSTVNNALELLMGIGSENDSNSLKAKEATTVGQMSGSSGTGLETNAGLVSIPEVISGQSVASTRNMALMACLKTGQAKEGVLLTVNEEELAKTLKIDEKKDSEGDSSSGDAGVDSEENDENRQQNNQEDLGGAAVLKPIPIQIGLGSSVPTIDIQEIANTASKSNPKATTITVLHHGKGDERPTAVQFKKSKKSKAVIPTGESLGIASPFTNRSYKGKKRFACASCHARYKSVSELERHIKKKHQRLRKFLCEICGEALATRASVKYHVSKKHGEVRQIFQCGVCDYSTPFGARMAIHQATHQSDFYCTLCKKSYVSAERLTKHYSSPLHKNALNPLVCEHCGYSTKKRDNFLVHMRKHTGEKPYKCKLCDYASADGSTLKKHVMAKHSTIRPFKCDLCSFSCVDKKGLDIHARKHTGERPFKCQYCLYAAKRRSALNVHLQTHSKDGQAVKQIKAKTTVGLPTEVASYETVSQIAPPTQQMPPQTQHQTPQQTHQQTSEQTPQQEQQYTTMANYQPTTLVTPVTQIVPQTAGDSVLQAKGIVGGLDATQDSYAAVQLPPGCVAKPVQTIWQNM